MDNTDFFTITPMTQHLSNLEPGKSYTGSITVVNPVDAKSDFNYKAYIAPYSVNGNDYNADLATVSDYNQIIDWITIDESDVKGTISPNHTKEIHFTITVPDNAPAGGQYAAIMVGQDNTNDATGNLSVNNILEIASIIYTDVAGETTHHGEILENHIPSFVTTTPITVSALLSNQGNVHETAIITITANDFFTGDIILEAKDQNDSYTELVMPETIRYIERDITDNLPVLGIVHVEQTIIYNGDASRESKDVIICPIWFMFLLIATLFLIIFIIVQIIRKHLKARKQKKAKREAKSSTPTKA